MNRFVIAIYLAYCVATQAATVTPSEWLASQTPPTFAAGHHLPNLSKLWSYQLPSIETYNLRVQMATNWGYALDFQCPNHNLVDIATDMADSDSIPYKALALAKSDPTHFQLQVAVDRFWSYAMPASLTLSSGFWCTNSSGEYVDATGTHTWTVFPNPTYDEVVSPESPQADWDTIAAWTSSPLVRIISSNAPVAIILNGGEYGLNAPKSATGAWTADPRVAPAQGALSVQDYASRRASNQWMTVASAIRTAVPARQLYIYYGLGTEQNHLTALADWFNDACNGFWSLYMHPTFDAPAFESYYPYLDTWLKPAGTYNYDLLTKHLNAVGYYISALNIKTNYSFVSGGFWTGASHYSAISTFTGFLKCLYTSGMTGATIYLEDPAPGYFNGTFDSASPPHWLQQIAALGRVHAQFSYLENFILNGDLLPGPSSHVMATDQSAYEFPTANGYNTRVLVRKLTASNEWLLAAWAADGVQTNVTVTVPTLGAVTLTAAAEGNLYRATTTHIGIINSQGNWITSTAATARANTLRAR